MSALRPGTPTASWEDVGANAHPREESTVPDKLNLHQLEPKELRDLLDSLEAEAACVRAVLRVRERQEEFRQGVARSVAAIEAGERRRELQESGT